MEAYYSSPSNQRVSPQVLYMREPFHYSFPEAPTLPGNMMMYVNSRSYSDALYGDSQQKTNYDAIPTIGSSNSTLQQQEILTNLGGLRTVQHEFGAWREHRSEQNVLSQGLSLSLGNQMPSFLSTNPSASDEVGNKGGNQDFNKGDYNALNGMTDAARTIPNSKYLKAAQQLLDEVVSVCKAAKLSSLHEEGLKSSKDNDDGLKDDTAPAGVSQNPQSSSANSQCELSHSERQELQDKLTKLLSMLDEVDRRYRQYYRQMQIVVSSFDAVAGCGAAKPYTAVALQTISRHFRCLHDAITGQIRATRTSLGEQDVSGNGNAFGITRLRFVDQQIRQQKALQQIGMMQQNAWRPQRGLPESSVSVLRAWLFEHFLNPYPKDSDKIMLARQTGLTRNQVSNWFINARVRLWKPMVEEMYTEEHGDEMHSISISSTEAASKATKGDATTPEARVDHSQQSQSATTSERYKTGNFMDSNLDVIPDVETARSTSFTGMHNDVNHEGITDYEMVTQKEEQRSNVDDCSMYSDAVAAAYHVSELEKFGTGNGISLTLGLQHFKEGNSHLTNGGHQGFVPMRVNDMYNAAAETSELECVGTENLQQRRSSSCLVHDFVA